MSITCPNSKIQFPSAQTNIQLYEQLRAANWLTADLERVHNCYQLAASLFSAQYRANGKPFVAHLVGTASILAKYHAKPNVVVAGLLHAAYDRGEFGTFWPRVTLGKRRIVTKVIGKDAEDLISRYVAFIWNSDTPAFLAKRSTVLSERDLDVVLIRLANELEEVTWRDLLYDTEIRRQERLDCLISCIDLANALGWSEMAAEINARYSEIDSLNVPNELKSQWRASFMLPPLSHSRRLRCALCQVLRLAWCNFPDSLRARARFWANNRHVHVNISK